MFRTFACAACVAALPALASPVAAQTAGDDLPAAENWWDRVGAGFFSDEGLTTPRPEHEILAHWTALSQDDQAAVLERCASLADRADATGAEADTASVTAPSTQRGSNTEFGGTESERALDADNAELPDDQGTLRTDNAPDIADEAADQTTITGAVGGDEVHRPGEGVEEYTGLAGGIAPDEAQLSAVCTVVAGA